MMPCSKPIIDETEEELLNISRSEVIIALTDKQILFCEIYTKTNNIRLAAKQAGYSNQNAHVLGWKLRQNPDCARYIAWLKARVVQESCIKGAELLDQYVRIAFADITDFLEKDKYGSIKIKDLNMIDGQLVRKITQRNGSLTVELYDKNFALQKLEQYFEFMPRDWRQRIEERKVELMEEKLKIEKAKLGELLEDENDDGFIEAIKIAATSDVWSDIEVDMGD